MDIPVGHFVGYLAIKIESVVNIRAVVILAMVRGAISRTVGGSRNKGEMTPAEYQAIERLPRISEVRLS